MQMSGSLRSGSLPPSEALSGPEQALAVAALLWHQHGSHMPLGAAQSWAASVHTAVGLLPRVKQLGSGWRLWILWFLHQAAVQFPVDQLQQRADGPYSWTKTWQASQYVHCTLQILRGPAR